MRLCRSDSPKKSRRIDGVRKLNFVHKSTCLHDNGLFLVRLKSG